MDSEYYDCQECIHGKLHDCEECEKKADEAYKALIRAHQKAAYDAMPEWKKQVKLTRYSK